MSTITCTYLCVQYHLLMCDYMCGYISLLGLEISATQLVWRTKSYSSDRSRLRSDNNFVKLWRPHHHRSFPLSVMLSISPIHLHTPSNNII